MGGMLSRFFCPKNDLRFVMVGITGAGKNTILNKLKLGELESQSSTTELPDTIGSIKFMMWDLGSQDDTQPIWDYYLQGVSGVIWVVDSADDQGLSRVKEDLHRIVGGEQLRRCPLLVLANKQDIRGALSPSEVENKLDLQKLKGPWHCLGSIGEQGVGIADGLDWLAMACVRKTPPPKKAIKRQPGTLLEHDELAKQDDPRTPLSG
eukprot:Hpha_TRINITY_DN8710_c0_g1::TRINITY_DN8710_c0_g1_i1::g.45293::m.45293/K07937/ARF1; ADP-ribosylation factor 1